VQRHKAKKPRWEPPRDDRSHSTDNPEKLEPALLARVHDIRRDDLLKKQQGREEFARQPPP
jgi:hypothetical protein